MAITVTSHWRVQSTDLSTQCALSPLSPTFTNLSGNVYLIFSPWAKGQQLPWVTPVYFRILGASSHLVTPIQYLPHRYSFSSLNLYEGKKERKKLGQQDLSCFFFLILNPLNFLTSNTKSLSVLYLQEFVWVFPCMKYYIWKKKKKRFLHSVAFLQFQNFRIKSRRNRSSKPSAIQ